MSNGMRILVFLHGTTVMHSSGIGRARGERVQQSKERKRSVRDYASYVPIGNAVSKLRTWSDQGATILYLSSHTPADLENDRIVQERHDFPHGDVLCRSAGEEYKDVVERIMPDVFIEDDCESIGGEGEMASPHLAPDAKQQMRIYVVPEFGGIDHLSDNLSELLDSAR